MLQWRSIRKKIPNTVLYTINARGATPASLQFDRSVGFICCVKKINRVDGVNLLTNRFYLEYLNR